MLLADDEHVARPITAAGTARFHLPPGVNPALSERLTIASPTASRGVSAFLIIPWRAARLRSGLAPTMHEPWTSRTSQVTRVRPSGALVTRAAWPGRFLRSTPAPSRYVIGNRHVDRQHPGE